MRGTTDFVSPSVIEYQQRHIQEETIEPPGGKTRTKSSDLHRLLYTACMIVRTAHPSRRRGALPSESKLVLTQRHPLRRYFEELGSINEAKQST